MTIESAASPMTTTMDGAFMEQRGRDRWQSLANGTTAKTAQQAKTSKEGGRRFESVRGLRVFSCLADAFVVSADGDRELRRPRSVHQRPPWTLAGAELVEQADRVLASVAREVAVVAVDHRQAGAHVAGEVEGRDAGTKSEGGKGVPEIVDPAQRLDPGRDLSGTSTRGCGSCAGRGSRPAGRGTRVCSAASTATLDSRPLGDPFHVTTLYLRCVTPGASTARTCSSCTSASPRLSKRRAPSPSNTGTTWSSSSSSSPAARYC